MFVLLALATVASLVVAAFRAYLGHRFDMAALDGVKPKDRAKVVRAIGEARRASAPMALASRQASEGAEPRSLHGA